MVQTQMPQSVLVTVLACARMPAVCSMVAVRRQRSQLPQQPALLLCLPYLASECLPRAPSLCLKANFGI